jgi:hypothetical protein
MRLQLGMLWDAKRHQQVKVAGAAIAFSAVTSWSRVDRKGIFVVNEWSV